MNSNPNLASYNQNDVQSLYQSGSITPSIDQYGNLIIQNTTGQMALTSITIPLVNVIFDPIKVETKYDVSFNEL